jgi:hypothetical protein
VAKGRGVGTIGQLIKVFLTDLQDDSGPTKKGKSKRIANKAEVLRYSRIIIAALEEALQYDPRRHHNQPPSSLRIDNADYFEDVRLLVKELKELNALLRDRPLHSPKPRSSIQKLSKHLDKFLSSYASALGKGAAALTIGSIGALLLNAGVGKDILDTIWGHLKLPK